MGSVMCGVQFSKHANRASERMGNKEQTTRKEKKHRGGERGKVQHTKITRYIDL